MSGRAVILTPLPRHSRELAPYSDTGTGIQTLCLRKLNVLGFLLSQEWQRPRPKKTRRQGLERACRHPGPLAPSFP